MSINARILNVFIASPKDTEAERAGVLEAIASWNGIHAESKRLVYVPLMYEHSAAAEIAENAQEVVDKQLFQNADRLIGIYKSRFGTPTGIHESGTASEIFRMGSGSAVYFHRSPSVEPNPEAADQFKMLTQFRESVDGLYEEYDEVSELQTKVRNRLDRWSGEIENGTQRQKEEITIYRDPLGHITPICESLRTLEEPTDLLLYNTELVVFRTFDRFREVFEKLFSFTGLQRVVLQLPDYKHQRLYRYLKEYPESVKDLPFLDRIFFSKLTTSIKPHVGRHPVLGNLSFSLLLISDGTQAGQITPPTLLLPLTEPFAIPDKSHTGPLDLVWDPKYCIGVDNIHEIVGDLREIWRESYRTEYLENLSNILNRIRQRNDPHQQSDGRSDVPGNPTCSSYERGYDKEREKIRFDLIQGLREKVFDPNVPSYLLNRRYFILDWNPAFEMIFPTDQLYRGQHVKDLVQTFLNDDEVDNEGNEVFGDQNTDRDLPPFHREPIVYQSPRYGRIQFSKTASKIESPILRTVQGWIIILNIDFVDKTRIFEEDLKRINKIEHLLDHYAEPYNVLMPNFPEYSALMDMHFESVKACPKIIEIGCGPGILAERLANEASAVVTAVDPRDDMINRLELRSRNNENIRILKAHLDTLHPLTREQVDEYKAFVPVDTPYDAVVMSNSLGIIKDPKGFLQTIRSQFIRTGGIISLSVRRRSATRARLFEALENDLENRESGNDESDIGYSDYIGSLEYATKELENEGVFQAWEKDELIMLLEETGFQVHDIDDSVFVGQAIYVKAVAG